MLISYRDSKRYPSDALALQAWVKMAEAMARQVVCPSRGFDALQFARALEVCRRLTRKDGPEAIRRMIHACAAAGVAVVLVPATTDCHASSASRWLVRGEGGQGRKAMVALSIRYRRDDQIYFSLFREAGAILKAEGRGMKEEEEGQPFSPDLFARQFLIAPEHDTRLAEMASTASASKMSEAISAFAGELGIASGLVVGRMQHDRLIPWTHQNKLKRVVDLSYVLEASDAVEETWPDQRTAARAVMKDFNMEAPDPARKRVARAVARGELLTNGQQRHQMRLEPGGLVAWRLAMRNRDLDAEDIEEAA